VLRGTLLYSTQLLPLPWMVIRSGTFTLLHSHTSTNIMIQGDRVSQLSQANGKQQADKPHREPIYLTNSCDIIQITATTNNNGYSLIVNHLKFRCCGRGHQYFSSIRYYRRWRSAWANPTVPSPQLASHRGYLWRGATILVLSIGQLWWW